MAVTELALFALPLAVDRGWLCQKSKECEAPFTDVNCSTMIRFLRKFTAQGHQRNSIATRPREHCGSSKRCGDTSQDLLGGGPQINGDSRNRINIGIIN